MKSFMHTTVVFFALALIKVSADVPILPPQINRVNIPQEHLELRAHGQLRVGDLRGASQHLVRVVENVGGWFLRWDDSGVEFRLPANALRPLYDSLGKYGIVEDKGISSEDLSLTLADLRAREQARTQLLEEYFSMLRTVKDNRLQVIERQMIELNAQLESLRGQIRSVEHRTQYAHLRLSFLIHDRTPVESAQSPFAWIQSLNLNDLQGTF